MRYINRNHNKRLIAMEKILITGVAGFIGSHVAQRFIQEGYKVIGVDDLSGGQRVFTEKDVEGLAKDDWTVLSFDGNLYPFLEYINQFALAALEGKPAPIPGEEGRRTLEVLVAAYRSGEENRPIELPL